MKAIALANLLYCCLTMGFVIYFSHQITYFGYAYFLAEICVIASLINLELKAVYKASGKE